MVMPQMALLQVAMKQAPPMQASMKPLAMQMTSILSMVSSSVMMVKQNQLGLMSAPLNIQGTQFQGSYIYIYIYTCIYIYA